jgi:hypothetical protein
MPNDELVPASSWLRRCKKAGAVAQGLALGFLVVLAASELASLAGNLSPFKYQGF